MGTASEYDEEFKQNALALVESGQTAASVSGLLPHSDCGCSTHPGVTAPSLLHDHGIRQSMSREGNCWDNTLT